MVRRRHNRDDGPSLQDSIGDLRSDYDAANQSRFRRTRTGIPAMGSHADWHIRNESKHLRLMEYARDLERNDPIVGRMLDLSADATVKDGITADATTGDSKLDDLLDERFKEWADDKNACDITGGETFGEMQHSAFRQMLLDGDIFAFGTTGGQVQHFEAHRVRSPSNSRRRKNLVYGVLRDEFRKPLEFWITKEDIGAQEAVTALGEVTQYPAYDENGLEVGFQLLRKKRATQTRGITSLGPIFDYTGMSGDTIFAKLVQQQSVSIWAWFIKRTNGYVPKPNAQLGSVETSVRADGTTEQIDNVVPGMIYRGEVGEELQAFNSNVPNAEFFQHMRQIHVIMMSSLGLPYMLVFLDASDTNFSGWRGAYDTAKFGWRRNQKNLITRYVGPIRRWKLTQFLEEDTGLARLARKRGVRPFACKFNLPSYPYVNPVQDAQAGVVRLANLLTSPQRFHSENGENAYDIATETLTYWGDMIEAAAKKADEVNKSLGLTGADRITWRDLLPKPNAQGMNVAINATPEADAPLPAKPQSGGPGRG